MSEQSILFQVSNAVARITLNRPDKLNSFSLGMHAELAQAPTRALAAIKRAIHAAEENTLDARLDLERDLQRSLGLTADYREGVAAFMSKRKPNFLGK